jgi:cellulose synthase operon protein C
MPVLRLLGPILLASAVALAGCDTAAERAETHYQRGLELLAQGDTARAMIEFRNVFRLDDDHVAARRQYAAVLREAGEPRQAMGQYLKLTEQLPQDAGLHRDLADVALQLREFETAGIHAARAVELDPADPMARALKATVDFRDETKRDGAVEMARGVLAEAPDTVPAHMVVIAERLAAGDAAAALNQIDTALATVPDDEELHLARLATLEQLGRMDAIGDELKTMAGLFPDNDGVRTALVQWHLRVEDPDGAEAVLRETAARDPDSAEPRLTLVQFLYEVRGAAAARTELEGLVATASDPIPYQRALADLDFAEGRPDEAIAALSGLLDGAEASDDTRTLQVALAAMLAETGAHADSAALIATVLEGDPGNVEALKLRARAAIDDDRPGAAIADMRTALGEAPRDPEIMTLMAMAHEREGTRDLMGERLALAVEASGNGAEESLRYATFLMQEEQVGPAEGVVTDALRRAPGNAALLNMLGMIHLEREDWTRVDQVAGILRETGGAEALAMANGLEAASLRGQGRTGDALALLEGLAGQGGDAAAMAELVRTRVAAGETAEARLYLEDVLAKDPASLPARLLLAGLAATEGDLEAAETGYRALIAEAPEIGQSYQALFTVLASQGRGAEAEAVLEAGIGAAADAGQLRFTRAGLREAQGDVAGAIADYEVLYAADSGSPVLANNLASLLSAPGTDSQDIERAFAIARRLRDSEQPHFQDTYGWILHLRGDSARGLTYLEPASDALPDLAQVWYHRGEAEFALRRWDKARTSFERALEAEEAGSLLPEAEAVRARLGEIETQGNAPAATDG